MTNTNNDVTEKSSIKLSSSWSNSSFGAAERSSRACESDAKSNGDAANKLSMAERRLKEASTTTAHLLRVFKLDTTSSRKELRQSNEHRFEFNLEDALQILNPSTRNDSSIPVQCEALMRLQFDAAVISIAE